MIATKLSKEEVIRLKTQLQDAYVRDSLSYPNVLFRFFTGFGKARTATQRMKQSPSKKKWLVLVPKIVLIDTFEKDYLKWGGDRSRLVDIICYDSLEKYTGSNYNVLCDEAAHVTPRVLEVLDTITSDERLFLSATISRGVIERIREQYLDLQCYFKSLSDGIQEGIAPEQDIRVIQTPLVDDHHTWPHTLTLNKKKTIVQLPATKKYRYLMNDVAYWKERFEGGYQEWQKNKWMQAALQRKNWMAEYKVDACRRVLEHLDNKGKRYICFVNSVEQAKTLGNATAIHSKQKPEVNQQLIQKFDNGEIDSLFSKDILAEGVNITVTTAVFLHVDHSHSAVAQKLGRVSARTEFPVVYVLVIPGSFDEQNFQKQFAHLGEFITTYNLI